MPAKTVEENELLAILPMENIRRDTVGSGGSEAVRGAPNFLIGLCDFAHRIQENKRSV